MPLWCLTKHKRLVGNHTGVSDTQQRTWAMAEKKEGALQNLQFLAERNQKIDQEIGQEIKDKQQQTNAQQAQDNKIKMGSKYKGSVTSFSDAGIAGYIAGEGNMNVVMREAVEEYNKDKDKRDQIIFVNALLTTTYLKADNLGRKARPMKCRMNSTTKR